MENDKKNYYDVLEISPNTSPREIELAYVRAKNAYSGDSVALYSLMSKEECLAVLELIEEAYSVLGFPEKRKEYDRLRGLNQPSESSNGDLSHPTGHHNEAWQKDAVQYEDFGSNLFEARVSKITAQKKFALEYNEDPEFERTISDCTDFTGQFLKKVREYKNVSVERMSDMIRVSKTHINAIENEEVTKLPADVYVRGYVYQYAKVLKLNPDTVATSYLLHFQRLKKKNK